MSNGIYAYGVVPAPAVEPSGLSGIDGDHSVRLLAIEELAAVISDVEIGQFEGDALARNVARPEWLEDKVRAHERVLDWLVRRGPVVPMRFGSIFSSVDLVHELLRDGEGLHAALERVRGKDEWGVKLHFSATQRVPELASDGPPVSGRDYLMQKRSALEAAQRTDVARKEVALTVHSCLSELATESALMAIQQGATGVGLNAAYLVAHENRDDFMRAAQDAEVVYQGAFQLEITGPWPPYNFTYVDVSGTVR